jgi:hypothetical protein
LFLGKTFGKTFGCLFGIFRQNAENLFFCSFPSKSPKTKGFRAFATRILLPVRDPLGASSDWWGFLVD